MSESKVQDMAKVFLKVIGPLMDATLVEMGMSRKKDEDAYYKSSRLVFKAMMAAAGQRILQDGGNQRLLGSTYDPIDAWFLYLSLNPEIAEKLQPKEPKAPPKPKAKNNLFQLIPGGLKVPETKSVCGCTCHESGDLAGHECCVSFLQKLCEDPMKGWEAYGKLHPEVKKKEEAPQ